MHPEPIYLVLHLHSVLQCYLHGCLDGHRKRLQQVVPVVPGIFGKDYITRVFVYRAYNLVPLDKWIGKTLNPYVSLCSPACDSVSVQVSVFGTYFKCFYRLLYDSP